MCVCAGVPTPSTAVSAISVWLTLTTTVSGSTPASDRETIGRKNLITSQSNSLFFKMPKSIDLHVVELIPFSLS